MAVRLCAFFWHRWIWLLWFFDLLRDRLFLRAHSSTFSISVVRVLALVAGMTRYVSSANFISLLARSFTVRSSAVTTYAAGPIPEPWMILAVFSSSSTSDRCRQCSDNVHWRTPPTSCTHILAGRVLTTSPAVLSIAPYRTPCWSRGRWRWRMGWITAC